MDFVWTTRKVRITMEDPDFAPMQHAWGASEASANQCWVFQIIYGKSSITVLLVFASNARSMFSALRTPQKGSSWIFKACHIWTIVDFCTVQSLHPVQHACGASNPLPQSPGLREHIIFEIYVIFYFLKCCGWTDISQSCGFLTKHPSIFDNVCHWQFTDTQYIVWLLKEMLPIFNIICGISKLSGINSWFICPTEPFCSCFHTLWVWVLGFS